MATPVLEFVDGSRPAYTMGQPDILIGRASNCAVQVAGDGVSDRHARITCDATGAAFIQDLDSYSGTLKNGDFVYGVQQLAEGDEIRIGPVALRFWPNGVPVGARPKVVSSRDAGVVVGTPDPEPTNNRTVQMEASDIARLMAMTPMPGQAAEPPPPARAPVANVPQPVAEPPKQRSQDAFAATVPPPGPISPTTPASALPKRTVIGMPVPVLPKSAFPSSTPAAAPPVAQRPVTAPRAAVPAPQAPPPAQAPMPSPSLSGAPLAGQRTAQLEAPSPQQLSTASTMMLEAPVLPVAVQTAPPPAVAQRPVTAQQPVANKPVTAQQSVATPFTSAPTMLPMAAPVLPQASAAPPPAEAMPQAAAYKPASTTTAQVKPVQGYVPPPRGSFGSFSRAFAFMGQMFGLAKQNKTLWKPLIIDLIVTTPISIAISVALSFVHSRNAAYALLGLGTLMLYFVDYACNSFTASLMFDQATTGEATMENARPRVMKALPGIFTFAAVSAVLDVASTYARERNDAASRILLRILRSIWTTATYVIMPALVIEGVSFGDAFKRSKNLMDHDPTGVGAGVVAMSIVSYAVGVVVFPVAWFTLKYASIYVHPILGGVLFFLFVNVYWSLSGWLKIAYSTCFYLWARECERTGSTDHALAPLPLRTAIDAG